MPTPQTPAPMSAAELLDALPPVARAYTISALRVLAADNGDARFAQLLLHVGDNPAGINLKAPAIGDLTDAQRAAIMGTAAPTPVGTPTERPVPMPPRVR